MSLTTWSRRALLTVTAIVGLLAVALPAQAQDGLLPVEQAYKVSAKIEKPGSIALHFTLADHYYLYRARFAVSSPDDVLKLGKLQLPDGQKEHDEYLGNIEIYHHQIDATLPYTVAQDGVRTAKLDVRVQGCHEVDPKICYPPYTMHLSLKLPATGAGTDAANKQDAGKSSGAGLLPARSTQAGNGQPLPADQAFKFDAIATSPTQLMLRWVMPPGYYLYRDKTQIIKLAGKGITLGQLQWPSGTAHHDQFNGDAIVYFNEVDVPVKLTRSADAAKAVTVQATFQGCLEHSTCYPQMTRQVSVPLDGGSAMAAGKAPANAKTAPTAPQTSLLSALLLALGGGLLLNLMPCVLPVLSIKAIGLLESREGKAASRRHALFYTAGVMVSFAVVGLAVLGLRAAGMAYGWGFQLQQPVFVAILAYIILAMGLSFSGVVQFGAGLAGTGQSLASRSGASGDFFTGVLAVVVASPCTAPAMGTALAFAFAAPPLYALLVFLALGIGLALPFLLIGFVPALGRWLPKPGAWMETLKEILAFPLYLTAAWLAWVLTHQRGADGVGLLLVGSVLLALGLWWFERSRHRGAGSKVTAGVLLLIALVPLVMIARMPAPSHTQAAQQGVVAFTPAKLAQLRKSGKPVFVDMTADWCITCKANEHAVLDTDGFKQLLKKTGAIYMKGDWTNEDPAITAFLQRYHSPGVPVYVVFPADGSEGTKLPNVLTMGIVREALTKAAAH
ncbi:protein-disulfide reductase DsbD [Oleiagrimonas sp. C23AA]|uniref:protein-disulfide reductase DsbD family protein n=1 Tax=Oleiagrimonas sp. C23AA TaxID=2719047 RepID=UPI0031B67BC7